MGWMVISTPGLHRICCSAVDCAFRVHILNSASLRLRLPINLNGHWFSYVLAQFIGGQVGCLIGLLFTKSFDANRGQGSQKDDFVRPRIRIHYDLLVEGVGTFAGIVCFIFKDFVHNDTKRLIVRSLGAITYRFLWHRLL